jgi:anthranilate phosphoribosyltransferase
LTVTAPTHVAELRDGNIREYEVNPQELGFKTGNLDEIRIDSPEESAKIIESIFACSEKGTERDIALINAAGALVVAGLAEDLKEGVEVATKTVDSGKAAEKMAQLVKFTQSV